MVASWRLFCSTIVAQLTIAMKYDANNLAIYMSVFVSLTMTLLLFYRFLPVILCFFAAVLFWNGVGL